MHFKCSSEWGIVRFRPARCGIDHDHGGFRIDTRLILLSDKLTEDKGGRANPRNPHPNGGVLAVLYFLLEACIQRSDYARWSAGARCGAHPLLCSTNACFLNERQDPNVIDMPVDILIRPADLHIDRGSNWLDLIEIRHGSRFRNGQGLTFIVTYPKTYRNDRDAPVV